MPEITRLANGVRILTETLPHVRSVTLGIWVKTGSRQDPESLSGIAHFTEHMLFKGTPSRDALKIAKDIDALGGVLNAQTSKEYTVYYVKVLDEHLNKASDVLFDIFLNSTLDSEELEKEKRVILQEIRMTEDTPDDYINDLFSEAFFSKSKLGIPILGTSETVSAIQSQDIRNFMLKAYDAGSIIVTGVGNIEHQELVELASPRFNGLKEAVNTESIETHEPQGGIQVHKRDLEQIHFNLGTVGPAMADDKRWTYIVLNTILGGSMSSMLFQEVREKLGLVYTIYSYVSAYVGCGVMAIYAATTPENIMQTMEVAGAQLRRVKSGDLGEMSLDEVKAMIRGNLLLSRESTESRMSSIAKNELYFQREVPIEEVLGKINAVSADAVIDLACEIFVPEKMTLVSLGADNLNGFDLAACI